MSRRALLQLTVLLCASSASWLAHSQEAEGEADVDGNAENRLFVGHTPQSARELVCEHATGSFREQISQPLFAHWFRQLRTKTTEDYFSEKPFMPHPSSACSVLNTTCCKPAAEKQLLKVVAMEFHELYRDVVDEAYLSQCPGVGRKFYHVMFEVIKETQRQLEIEVGQALGHQVEGHFEEFFKYLLQFIFHFDFCPLESHLQAETEKMFQAIYYRQGGKNYTSEDARDCFDAVSQSFVRPYVDKLKDSLEVQLSDLKLFLESVRLAEKMVKLIQGYTFSPECVRSLMQLKYCAYCGGFVSFKPCLFFCINTLRGCTADIAELHEEFEGFLKAMRVFSRELVPQLEPQGFISGSLNIFVRLARELRSTSLKAVVSSACEPTTPAQQKRFTQTIRPQSEAPVTEMVDVSYDILSEIVTMELTCLGMLDTLLTHVPEEICYLSKNHIAQAGNHQCWTGNTLGTYDRPLVGLRKSDQLTNPSFASPPSPNLLFQLEKAVLRNQTLVLNRTVDEYLCLDRDDEDCKRSKFLYSCGNGSTPTDTPGTTDPPTTDRYGSGIGSGGYYSGDESGLIDQEPDEPEEESEDSRLPPNITDEPTDPDSDNFIPDASPPVTFETETPTDAGDEGEEDHETIDILDTNGNPMNTSDGSGGSGVSTPEATTATTTTADNVDVTDNPTTSSSPGPDTEGADVPTSKGPASGSAVIHRIGPLSCIYMNLLALALYLMLPL